jgi:hypothetical protein
MPIRKHSPETLALAVAFSWCLTDLLERLGEPQDRYVRRHVAYLVRKDGLDTSHWDPSPRRYYTDDALRAAVAKSVSYAAALRLLGVPVTGGQHAHLARRIRRAGIDTSHFLGQAHNRGRTWIRREPTSVLVVLPEGSDRPQTKPLRRALLTAGVPEVCALCGSDGTWLGQPLRLVIDHIDGSWLNNLLENLRFLCPNCHAQTSTWCRKTSSRRNA